VNRWKQRRDDVSSSVTGKLHRDQGPHAMRDPSGVVTFRRHLVQASVPERRDGALRKWGGTEGKTDEGGLKEERDEHQNRSR